MIFNTALENKSKKAIVLFLGVIVIVAFWYAEKTKTISPYGVIFYEMGMRCNDECGQDKKMQYFQKAIRHNSNLSAAHYQLALIYEQRGDHDKTLELFRRVTELTVENSVAFYKVGVQHFKEGAYERALRYFLQSNKYKRRLDDTFYYLARIYDRKGEYDLAAQYYYESPSRYPECTAESFFRYVEINHLLNKDNSTESIIRRLRESNRFNTADQLEQAFKAVQNSTE